MRRRTRICRAPDKRYAIVQRTGVLLLQMRTEQMHQYFQQTASIRAAASGRIP